MELSTGGDNLARHVNHHLDIPVKILGYLFKNSLVSFLSYDQQHLAWGTNFITRGDGRRRRGSGRGAGGRGRPATGTARRLRTGGRRGGTPREATRPRWSHGASPCETAVPAPAEAPGPPAASPPSETASRFR